MISNIIKSPETFRLFAINVRAFGESLGKWLLGPLNFIPKLLAFRKAAHCRAAVTIKWGRLGLLAQVNTPEKKLRVVVFLHH